MAGSPEAANSHGGMSLLSPIRFALRTAPDRFTPANFAQRLFQHLIVYGLLLTAAVYSCLFVYAPIETALISVACVLVAGFGVALSSASDRKFNRLVSGGVAAIYIAGAAALLRGFEAVVSFLFLHRM